MSRLSLVLFSAALATAAACNKNKKDDTVANKGGEGSNEVGKVDPTLCETSGKNVMSYDLNRDGRPDVWKMYKVEDQGGTNVEILTCKQVDFDHDGRKDWVVGYTPKGTPAFEKADFDYDGRFDMSAIYDPKTGKRLEVERDSDFDGKYDIKELYDRFETLTAVRRDRNADGNPDYWEQYKDGALVAILYDDDYDNKVDRREEVPGSRPKFVAPEADGRDATTDLQGSGLGSGAGSAAAPAAGSGSGSAAKPK